MGTYTGKIYCSNPMHIQLLFNVTVLKGYAKPEFTIRSIKSSKIKTRELRLPFTTYAPQLDEVMQFDVASPLSRLSLSQVYRPFALIRYAWIKYSDQ
jgi:hypothetical protein